MSEAKLKGDWLKSSPFVASLGFKQATSVFNTGVVT